MSVFENLVRYGMDIKYLNTNLNRQDWQIAMFQYCAGDLYEILPELVHKATAQ